MKWFERSFSWRKATVLLAVAGLSFSLGAWCGGVLHGHTTPPGGRSGPRSRPGTDAGSPPVSRSLCPMPGEFVPQAGLLLGCRKLLQTQPRILLDMIQEIPHEDFEALPVKGVFKSIFYNPARLQFVHFSFPAR